MVASDSIEPVNLQLSRINQEPNELSVCAFHLWTLDTVERTNCWKWWTSVDSLEPSVTLHFFDNYSTLWNTDVILNYCKFQGLATIIQMSFLFIYYFTKPFLQANMRFFKIISKVLKQSYNHLDWGTNLKHAFIFCGKCLLKADPVYHYLQPNCVNDRENITLRVLLIYM